MASQKKRDTLSPKPFHQEALSQIGAQHKHLHHDVDLSIESMDRDLSALRSATDTSTTSSKTTGHRYMENDSPWFARPGTDRIVRTTAQTSRGHADLSCLGNNSGRAQGNGVSYHQRNSDRASYGDSSSNTAAHGSKTITATTGNNNGEFQAK